MLVRFFSPRSCGYRRLLDHGSAPPASLKARIKRKGQALFEVVDLQFSTTPLGSGNYAHVDVDDVIVERRLSGVALALSLRTHSAFLIALFL